MPLGILEVCINVRELDPLKVLETSFLGDLKILKRSLEKLLSDFEEQPFSKHIATHSAKTQCEDQAD